MASYTAPSPPGIVAPLDGLPLIGYGHSYMQGILTGASESWIARAARRLGMTLANRGVGGDRMVATLARMFGSGGTVWVPGSKGLVVIESELNDVRSQLSAADLIGFKNCLREAIAFLLAGSGTTDAATAQTVYTGAGWTPNAAQPGVYNSTQHYTQAQNDRVDITLIIPASGEVTLLSNGYPGAGGVATFVLDPAGANTAITPIGGTAGTFNLNAQCGLDAFVPCPLRFTGLPSGSHVIRMTKTDAGSGYVVYNGYFLPALNPPSVIICKEASIGAASWALYGPAWNTGSDTVLATYHAGINAVLAEFAGWPVSSVDLGGAGWNPANDLSAVDLIHPNDFGTNHLAAAFVAAARALTARAGLLQTGS